MGRQLVRYAVMIALIYVAGYLVFRMTQQEVWAQDGKAYVMFPEGVGLALYYLWRPLMYVDGMLTRMAFHIGPHQ